MATVEEAPIVADEELLQEDESLYEIIDGIRLELPIMGAYSCLIATRIVTELVVFGRLHNLGQGVMATLFHLSLPADRNRRPDVAFVSYSRWPKGKPQSWLGNAWDVVPDLAVEVISPNDLAVEILVKIAEYFRAGVRLVWIVYPNLRLIHVYSTFTTIQV